MAPAGAIPSREDPHEIRAHRNRGFLPREHVPRQRRSHRPADDQFVPAPRHRRQGEHVLQQPQVEKRMPNLECVNAPLMSQSSNSDCHRTALNPSYPSGLTRDAVTRTDAARAVPSLSAPAPCGEFFVQPVRKHFLPPFLCARLRPSAESTTTTARAGCIKRSSRQRADQREPRVVRPRDATDSGRHS